MLEIAAITIGLHIGSWHSEPGRNNVNPGIYAVTQDGWTAGVYRNSWKRTSVYAGRALFGHREGFALTVGAISGYSHTALMVVPSYRIGPARISYLPKFTKEGSHVVHFSVEKEF